MYYIFIQSIQYEPKTSGYILHFRHYGLRYLSVYFPRPMAVDAQVSEYLFQMRPSGQLTTKALPHISHWMNFVGSSSGKNNLLAAMFSLLQGLATLPESARKEIVSVVMETKFCLIFVSLFYQSHFIRELNSHSPNEDYKSSHLSPHF